MTTDHAAALKVLDVWENFDHPDDGEYDSADILISGAIRELAALYRAASKFPGMWDAFKTARNGGNMEEAYYCLAKGKHAHWDELTAALAAVADKLTGEGK